MASSINITSAITRARPATTPFSARDSTVTLSSRTILASIRSAANGVNDDGTRRRELVGQLERLRDLYVMGDLSKSEYVLRRQAFEEERARVAPPFDPRLDKAEELLADFQVRQRTNSILS